MENLSGIPDVDKLILLNLDDQSLTKAASVLTDRGINDDKLLEWANHNKKGNGY